MFVVPNKTVFWRRRVPSVEGLKRIKFMRINCISDFQPGDGFAPGSVLSNSALFGNACQYHPDFEIGEGVLIPCYMLLYFCLKA